jgi:hypothetical protein
MINNNEQYRGLAKSTNIKINSEPKPHAPEIKKTDTRRGYIVRRFVQKTNDNFSPVSEVSRDGFGMMSANPLYRAVSLKWRITGTKEEIKKSNKASISEQLKIMPQLKNRLVNFLEYSKI